MTATLTDTPAVPWTFPRPALDPDSTAKAAACYLAGGLTPAAIRNAAHPADAMLHAIADAAERWVTPSYCDNCHGNHPGPCGCWCHQPAATAA